MVDCPTCGLTYDEGEETFRTGETGSSVYVFLCDTCHTVFDHDQDIFISLSHAGEEYDYDGDEDWNQVNGDEHWNQVSV